MSKRERENRRIAVKFTYEENINENEENFLFAIDFRIFKVCCWRKNDIRMIEHVDYRLVCFFLLLLYSSIDIQSFRYIF